MLGRKSKALRSNPSRLEMAVSKLHNTAELANRDVEDQYTNFGSHITSQLRELPLRSFLILQEKFQALITQERLNSIQILHPSPPCSSFHSSSCTSSLTSPISVFPSTIQASPNTYQPSPCEYRPSNQDT